MQGGGKIEHLDIGGHVIYIGTRVNVQWRGVWYDGSVVKIGPKRNLCKVRDLTTDKTLLMTPKQLKFMETHALKKNFTQGTHVAYNDGDQWMEGVVEKENAVGAALVRWRKSIHAAETDSWFEVKDIAPVIRNEAYLSHDDVELAAGRSGLLQNNMIEPHPRTVQNTLYKSDDEFEVSGSPDHDRSRSPMRTHQKNYTDYDEEPHHFTLQTSPTYESIPSPIPFDSPAKQTPGHRPLPSPPNSPYTGLVQPPMVFPHIIPYRYDWSKTSNRYQHPKPPMRKNLEQTSIPVALTYKTHYSNGIPPHHSSSFFNRLKSHHSVTDTGHRPTSANQQSRMKQSPSIISATHSEPIPFAFQPATKNIIPPRNVGKSSVKRHLFKERKWGWRKTSTKIKKQAHVAKVTPEPSPYEIPLEISPTLSEVGEIEEENATVDNSPEKRNPSHGDLSANIKSRDTSPKRHHAPPILASASPSNLSVNTGGHLLLTCVAKSAKPASYEWSKDGATISLNGLDDNLSVPSPGMLEIKKATLEDAGEYTCTVSNENGSIEKSFKVYVVEDFFSVFSNSPSKADSGLQTKFTTKVSVDELQQDHPVDRSVQEFLNEIVEDIHISDDDIDLEDLGTNLDDENEIRKPADGKESSDVESDTNEKEEQKDVVHELPSIVVTAEHVPEKQVRRRHSVMRNDMEQYLEGYGQDYGALSSATDLEQEGLKHYKAREIAKKTKAEHKKDKKTSQSTKPKSKRFLRFPKFHKTSKTEIEVQDLTYYGSVTEGNEMEMQTVQVEVHDNEQNPDKEDENSIAVNTSLGSTESLIAGVEEDEGHVTLPLEIETVTDQVRRLQQSLEEYEEESFSVQDGKKKGVFSSIFSSKVK